MALSNKKSVLALVAEVTENVPVAPTSAADDYVALQEGFTIEPAFEELESAELQASIGKAKSILGFENPTLSFSHYLKSNGVGIEPNFGIIFEALLGAKSIASTEYDTVSGSTAGTSLAPAVIKVNTGEGATFERGESLLIKGAVSSSGFYSIRPIHSISGDDLQLAFNLASAPGVGILLGQSVLYKPANDSHPTFSAWCYRANGGAVELLSGCRPTSATINVEAGQLINCDFSIGAVEYRFNPINITSSTRYFDFTDDAGTFAAVVPTGYYKDPIDLAAALEAAIAATATTETITVAYSSTTGKFTIATATSAVLSLLWNTGANTANTIGSKIGFSTAADDTGAITYTSDNAQVYTSPQTPTLNSNDPLVAKNNEVLFGDFDDYACFAAVSATLTINGEKTDLLSICAESGKAGSLITARDITVSLVARLEQHDVDKFHKFHTNSNVRFCINVGEKIGGNWVAGKCVSIYIPTATIKTHNLTDNAGVVQLEMEIGAYVDSGLGEIYINHV